MMNRSLPLSLSLSPPQCPPVSQLLLQSQSQSQVSQRYLAQA